MSSWKLYLFLLVVAVGSVVSQNDPDAEDPTDADSGPPTPADRPCDGCKDGDNCWYEGDSFLKNEEEHECIDGKIEKRVDPKAGMCLAHSAVGQDKWLKPDEEYELRCNTWKCSGQFKIMEFVKAACRDDMDKCFDDGETLVKNGNTVICRIYGSGHVYEFPPPAAEPTEGASDAGM
ncbi:uncharacterized protein LOC135488674 [Lineus longissimus]|uniref:uncharacterized protein LOC135488674 n=1 Tax=Lineus longissimus TaxID=88925 RepID=UPI002B4D5086